MLKRAPYQASDELLKQARKVSQNHDERDLFFDIGMFVSWYAAVELAITKTLAVITNSHDLEAFDILCRGMDARVKVERLRKFAKRTGGFGSNLSARMAVFERDAIPLRNKLVHSVLTYSEDAGPRKYFISGLSNMPWVELGMGEPTTSSKPDIISSIDLYAWATWLSFFGQDLNAMQPLAIAQKQLEIESPRSRLS